jgi:hypothetical protein
MIGLPPVSMTLLGYDWIAVDDKEIILTRSAPDPRTWTTQQRGKTIKLRNAVYNRACANVRDY